MSGEPLVADCINKAGRLTKLTISLGGGRKYGHRAFYLNHV